ncbi:MAG: GGDEF domain-containing protein [Candidatus Sericytochromatia bacterium]
METNSSEIKDQLTGVFNYTYFQEVLKQEILRSNRYNKPYSIVRIDIDNFKTINEKYGFDFGNTILIQLATLLKDKTRASDVLSRQEAEEFVIMLPEVATDDAVVFAERMRKIISNYDEFGDDSNKIKITVSMGISSYVRKEEMDLTQILELLDTAVYQAKENGRNCIVTYKSLLPTEDSFI